MKLRQLVIVNAVLALFAGIAFSGYGPMMLRFFDMANVPWPVQSNWEVWLLIPFVRMFGAVLVVLGGLLIAISQLLDNARTRLIVAGTLALVYLWAAFIAVGQEVALWGTTGGKLIAAAFVAMLLGYFYFWIQESNRSSQRHPSDDLQSAWSRQISEAAAQQERNRLARDLHDSIKQQIFSINVSAATAQARFETDPGGAKTALADVRTSAHDALAEMEAMLQNLRPVPLETIGLIEALRKQGEALQYRTGAKFIAEFGELPEPDRLPLGTQETVFRVAQEALSNIARHARAQAVTLRLGTDADKQTFSLTITDDGQGFDTQARQSGMGMKNMHSRTRELNGELQVESLPNQGTRLSLRLPLRHAERDHIKLLFRLAAFGGIAGTLVLGSRHVLPSPTYSWRLWICLTLWLGGAIAGVMGFAALSDLKAKAPEPTVRELERYFWQLCFLFFLVISWLG